MSLASFRPIFFFVLLMLGVACQPPTTAQLNPTVISQLSLPTSTPKPTASPTPLPTSTPLPTLAPPATATSIPTSTATPTPEYTPTATATATPEPSYVVHLAAVGDIMLSRTLGNVINDGNLEYPFKAMYPYLQPADLTIGNLETALGDIGEPEPKAYPFQSPPAAAESLALAGFDIVSLANNHALDYGPEALLQGIELLKAQNITPIGAGANYDEAHQPYVVEVNGLKLAFLAYANVPIEGSTSYDVQTWTATETTPGMAWGTEEIIAADVAAIAPHVDHVIVNIHFGFEYIQRTVEIQQQLAYAAVNAGARVVIGHHTHLLQGMQIYNGSFIAYGLGNFAFNIDGPPETAVLHLWLDKTGVTDYQLIPAMVTETGAPRPATPEEATAIFTQLAPYNRLR